ncbi:MAG: hypothetical protein M1825_001623 [Sarcosagium campestre]|nr:MAG: hypothetical protein M1825_001623 [Sarcosagium campestre]
MASSSASDRPSSQAPSSKSPAPPEAPARDDIVATFKKFGQVLHAALRPLPTQTGDGTYLDEPVPSSLIKDLANLGFKDVETLKDLVKQKLKGELNDDKTYLMERVIQMASVLPSGSKSRDDLTTEFIGGLWDNLLHPPLSYVGEDFTYRQADGSNNNILYPHLGAANTPYARTVQPETIQKSVLPDPGQIFDSVMARREYRPHPNGISSMLFYIASIIIHDLFLTSHTDSNYSRTSSYLDLSPLYGNTESEQKKIRTYEDGRLKPDCFSEKRLLGFPPGVGCILIMFNRFHNHVVESLAEINESGRFTKPSKGADPAKFTKYDNDLFQTGRLIVCGLYVNIILLDYVRTIINLNRTNSTWNLDPRTDVVKVFGKHGAPRGIGNQVSAEFNLIYRWHSAVSKRDEHWTEAFYAKLFPNKKPDEVTMPELLQRLRKMDQETPDDPHKRPFAGLKRQADGTFNDDELSKILIESIEDRAGAFGANNVPPILRSVEILGIEQARKWNLATLNEFRKFFGLKPHHTFEDINSDAAVAEQLRRLYDHPDYVELYPGVVAEEAKIPMTPGSGLATTFTISRAILSDAVSLVRGDRFYTVDYNPKNLTNWGYKTVQHDVAVEQGCVFYKLFLTTLPHNFKPNSVYAHYPLTIPSENEKILQGLGRSAQYDFERPSRITPHINITSYSAAKSILENQKDFHVTWFEGLEAQIDKPGGDFMLSGDTPFHHKQREIMDKAIYPTSWRQEVKKFYEQTTLRLLKEKSYQIAGVNQVDIVRDVGNPAQAHFAANIFSLPLKTEDNPFGIFSEQELYLILTVMFIRVFFDLDPAKSFPLTQAARQVAQQIGALIQMNVDAVSTSGILGNIIDRFHRHHTALTSYGVHMIRKLLDSGLSAHDVTWTQMVPSAAAMVANQAQIFAQVVDFFLSEAGASHFTDMQKIAAGPDTPEADETLLHYGLEATRLSGAFGAYREVVNAATVEEKGKPLHLKPGERVLISFNDIARDPAVFPSPNELRLDRPLDSYIHYGAGPHECLGKGISFVALTAMLRSVARLKNLRRAPGPQGRLKAVSKPGGWIIYMREDWSDYFPFPTTMRVQFDGDVPDAPE